MTAPPHAQTAPVEGTAPESGPNAANSSEAEPPAQSSTAFRVDVHVTQLGLAEAFHATRLGQDAAPVALWLTAQSVIFAGDKAGITCVSTVPVESSNVPAEQPLGLSIADADLFTRILSTPAARRGFRTAAAGQFDPTVRLSITVGALDVPPGKGQLRVTLGQGEDALVLTWPCAFTPDAPPVVEPVEGHPLAAAELRDALTLVQPFTERSDNLRFSTVQITPTYAQAETSESGRHVTGLTLPELSLRLLRQHAGDLVTVLRHLGGEEARIALQDDVLVVANARTQCRVQCAKFPVSDPVLPIADEIATATTVQVLDALTRILTQSPGRGSWLRFELSGGPAATLRLSVEVSGGTASLSGPVQRAPLPEGESYPTRTLYLRADELRGGRSLGQTRSETVGIHFIAEGIRFVEVATDRQVCTVLRKRREQSMSDAKCPASPRPVATGLSTSAELTASETNPKLTDKPNDYE